MCVWERERLSEWASDTSCFLLRYLFSGVECLFRGLTMRWHCCRQLWMFVSNFTDLDHDKLRKLYKKTASKRREEDKEVGQQALIWRISNKVSCVIDSVVVCGFEWGWLIIWLPSGSKFLVWTTAERLMNKERWALVMDQEWRCLKMYYQVVCLDICSYVKFSPLVFKFFLLKVWLL